MVNRLIRLVSVALLGIVAMLMFLAYEPVIPGGKTPIDFAMNEQIVRYLLPALLLVSAFLCNKGFGFKNKKIFRGFIAILAIAVPIATRFVPEQIELFGYTAYLRYLVLGGGYAVVFLFLFFLHLAELGSRKGLSKIFAPLADLAMVMFVAVLYVVVAVPIIVQAPFYQYIEYGLKYGHYVVGGILSVELLFAIIELFVRKAAI